MKIRLILNTELLDAILLEYKSKIGADYQKYRGHCYRVLNYIWSIGMEQDQLDTVACAIAFHELGIWTAGTMDYLEPSCELAANYIIKNALDLDTSLVTGIIINHHKITKVRNKPLAELLRQAEMIDMTKGKVRFGIAKAQIKLIQQRFPSHGFQAFIFKKVIRHACQHIFRPFPMLKI